MADLNNEILKTLKMIEQYTKTSASGGSKTIGRGNNQLGNESGNKFQLDNLGLIASFKNLKKAIVDEAKAKAENNKIIASQNVKNRATNKALDDLKNSVIRQIKDGKSASTITNNVTNKLKGLGDIGEDLLYSFRLINDTNKGEFITSIHNASEELNKLANSAKAAISSSEQYTRESRERLQAAREESEQELYKSVGAAITTAVSRLSQSAMVGSGSSFVLGEPTSGMGGLLDSFTGLIGDSVEAFKTGASPEDAYRFAAANREALSTATRLSESGDGVMLNARAGMEAVTEYGNKLNNMFGLKGADQLNAIGQSLSALTNSGTKPTQEALSAYADMVGNLAATSNKTGAELFAEFENLTSDADFQQLFLSMGKGASITDYLNNSFLHLQKTVGLNIDEFISYQKFLAEQQKRTGSTRVVQAAFAGQLARGMGYSKSDIALIQKGTAFREALSGDELARFDTLNKQMGVRGAEMRAGMAQRMDVAGLQAFDIYQQGANLQLEPGVAQRELAEVVGTQQEAQTQRLEAANEKNIESLKVINNSLREILDGIANSALGGAAASFFSTMGAQVFAGTLAGNLAANAGGAVGLLGKAGIFGAGAIGAGMAGFSLGTWLTEATGLDKVSASAGDALYELINGDPTQASAASKVEQRVREEEKKYDERIDRQIAEIQKNEQLIAENKDTSTATLEEIKESNRILKEMLEQTLKEKEDALLKLKNPARRPARGQTSPSPTR